VRNLSNFRAEEEQARVAAVAEDLTKLSRRGAAHLQLVQESDYPALVGLADLDRMEAAARTPVVHHLLGRAVESLAEPERSAALAFMRFDPDAAASLGQRRELAAKRLGISPDTFRTHRERRLIRALAEALMVQAEQRQPSPVDRAPSSERVLLLQAGDPRLRDALRAFIHSVGLSPVELEHGLGGEVEARPALDLLRGTMESASAIVVALHPGQSDSPRQNIFFEMGMAMGIAPEKTLLVSTGRAPVPSDLAGWHVVELDNSPVSRNQLLRSLETLGCPVISNRLDWMDPSLSGDFAWQPLGSAGARPVYPVRQQLREGLGTDYEVISQVAQGAFSSVWRGRDRDRRDVVIYLLDNTVWPKRDLRGNIERLREIRDDRVAVLREAMEMEDHTALVAELIGGISLDELGPVQPSAALALLVEVLEGLGALHSHGLSHGSLDADSILVAEGARPVLVDLVSVVAPETSPADDLFGAAVLLCGLILGRRLPVSAFTGSRDLIGTLDLSPQLKTLLQRVVKRDPTLNSALALAEALRGTPEWTLSTGPEDIRKPEHNRRA
jgi:hypothetical protein